MEANRFGGASVVLFLTMGSSYSRSSVEELERWIGETGGVALGHVPIRREKRTGEAVEADVRAVLDEKAAAWVEEATGQGPGT